MSKENNDTIWMEELFQSDVFGEHYKKSLDLTGSTAPSLFTFQDIEATYTGILMNSTLSEFQQKALLTLFQEFNKIRGLIDPNRLKSFDSSMNEDKELLIFRKSSLGLTNIIIHDEECIAFSFIPYNPENKTMLEFVQNPAELDKLALLFFSY